MIRRIGPLQRALVAFLIALALHAVGTLLIDGYSSEFSIRSQLALATLLGVASVGQTLVVLLGGIDLSIPFVIGFANVVAAKLYGGGMNFVAAWSRRRSARSTEHCHRGSRFTRLS
jgi:ribose transport system permease protein